MPFQPNAENSDHPLREIAERVDFDFVRQEVKDKYGYNGSVSVDPSVIERRYHFGKPVVVADAAMLSKVNLDALDAAKYPFIVAGRLRNETQAMMACLRSWPVRSQYSFNIKLLRFRPDRRYFGRQRSNNSFLLC